MKKVTPHLLAEPKCACGLRGHHTGKHQPHISKLEYECQCWIWSLMCFIMGFVLAGFI